MAALNESQLEVLFPYPRTSEWNKLDAYLMPSEMDHFSLDLEVLEQVKELHVQVENYLKALPVNEECIAEAVDTLVGLDCPLPVKFSKVNVADLIKKNKNVRGPDSLSTLVSALGLLEKYGRNLMKPERPALWKLINFANSVFRTRVDIIKGARDVLQLMGYSEVVEDGLTFPSDVESPHFDTVAIVTADLAIAKRETELYSLGKHPHAYRFKDCLDGTMAVIQVPGNSPTARPQRVFMRRPERGSQTRFVYENVALQQSTQERVVDQFQHLHLGQEENGTHPSEVVLTKPNPYLSTTSPVSQSQDIVHKIGDPTPSSRPAPADIDIGLAYFASPSGKTAVSTVQPSTKFSTQPVSQQPAILIQYPDQKTESDKPSECVMCGKTQANLQCSTCSGLRCDSCDKQWHLHPNRRSHQRKAIEPSPVIDTTAPSSPLPVLLCHVCGISSASVFCVNCSSSTCSGEYCSDCDRVYHGHPLRQDHSREPLESRRSEAVTKPPPKTIVLSPLDVATTSQEPSKATETSVATLRKRPIPAPRRSIRNSAVKEPPEPVIPEGMVSDDDVFTTKEGKETQPEIKRPPTRQTTLRSQSESTIKDTADEPVSPKPYHSVPSAGQDIYSEVHTVIETDIKVLQKIRTRRDMMATCDKSLPTYNALQAEISSLMSEHCNLQKRQIELESMINHLQSENAGGGTEEEQPQVKYPPVKDYQERLKQQVTNTPTSQVEYPPAVPQAVPVWVPFTPPTPASKPPVAAKPLSFSATRQQSPMWPATVASPQTPAVQSHPEVTPARPSVAINTTVTMQPGYVQHKMNRIKSVGASGPADGTQALPVAWVCLQCGNHNTSSPSSAVCMTCGSPMPMSTTQKPSVATLGQQLGASIPIAVPQHQLQRTPFLMGMKPVVATQPNPDAFRRSVGGAPSGGSSIPIRAPLKQPEPMSVFTYLQMEEEAMLKEKQKAREEYERQLASQGEEKPKTPSPPPRLKKDAGELDATAQQGAATSHSTKQKPSQGGVFLQTPPQEGSVSPRSVSPSRSHILWVEEKKRLDQQRAQSLAFIEMLREAEDSGFCPEEVVAATEQMQETESQSASQLRWLQNNWDNYISTVTTMATNHLKEEVGKSVGMVRKQEAKQALRKHHGNVEKAVEECVLQMQKRVWSLVDLGFSHKRVCESLSIQDGSLDDALSKLQRERAAEFIDRIWCPEDPAKQEKMIVDLGVDRHPDTVERRLRILLVEYELPSWGRAVTATKLIDMGIYDTSDAITAARQCGGIERAKQYLEKACSVCFARFSMNKLSTLIHCQCMICLECLHGHFNVVINNRNILNANCPACNEPDLHVSDLEATADYFGYLDILLKGILEKESYQVFQNKMRDWSLMKEKNFRWCAHCGNGFINEAPNRRKMRCNECNGITCFQCKKQWMEQHENTSCADFQAWKEANDPNRQAEGLAIHLKENGIDCPHCKMRYELAKGGCMHFKCVQCTHEFCCGCSSPFKKANECGLFEECRKRGFHAHHPRDCLFYLRDLDIKSLQKLLQKHQVDFKRDNPDNQQEQCSVMEQKEGPDGLKDDQCGRAAVHAGLCEIHYKEYLVSMINQNHIDPADEYNCDQLRIILDRNKVDVPARLDKESEAAYKGRLLQEVKAHLPLEKKNPRDRGQ